MIAVIITLVSLPITILIAIGITGAIAGNSVPVSDRFHVPVPDLLGRFSS
jgi:hypothetical protein